MDNRARLTGYAFASVLLLIALWIFGALYHEAFHTRRVIQVQFPELGTLMKEDPVLQNGVPIGKVKSIELRQGVAVAEMEMFRRGFIAKDSRFINFNHSLMGARMVVLVPGHSALPMDESEIQNGIFADGVAESIHRVNDLLTLVTGLRAEARKLFEGDRAPLSPELLNNLENNARSLNRLSQKMDQTGKSLHTGLDTWIRLENSIPTGLKTVQSGLNTAENQTRSLLNTATSAEQNADRILNSAERLLASVRDSTGMAHTLLYDRSAYEELEASLNVLETALRTFQEKGLNGAVRWRNLHFFPSKSP